jgi:tRNA (guanine37-N1)-methyltransferase
LNPHIRVVLRRASQVEGQFRTRKVEVMAGSGGMETIYKEFSCRYHLDVSTVYFNPRLSHERMRIADQVMPDESVVDMFAGVGPYSILIAKLQPKSSVYAVDINPTAIKYLRENIFANTVADRVLPMLGDVKVLASKALRGRAARLIMNLPSEAISYLPAASQILRDEGGIIHFYAFSSREEKIDKVLNSFRSNVEAQNRRVESVRFCKVIKEVAPNRVQVAIDAVLSSKAPQ